MLNDLVKLVDTLSRDDLEALNTHIQQRREVRETLLDPALGAIHENGDRRNDPLDIDELKQIFAELRKGFTEQDLEELEWAMNVEYIEPLDDELHP